MNKNLFFIHLILKNEIFNYIYFIFKINNIFLFGVKILLKLKKDINPLSLRLILNIR